MEPAMTSRLRLAALVAATILSSSAIASAQTNAAGGQVGPSGVILSPGAVPATTGMGGGASQPGAPGTTSPGRIGTGAAPSGLAGDNPSAPGFPGKVGR
jgi:hypothetical protein